MPRYLESGEAEQVKYFMNIAAEIGKKSECLKSHRGVVIVKNEEIIGHGYIKVPKPERYCQPCLRRNIRDNSRTEACGSIHAEHVAIEDVLIKYGSRSLELLEDSTMYHIKLKNRDGLWVPVPSGKPSCTRCSIEIVEKKIREFILWHEGGYAAYGADELDQLSRDDVVNNMPEDLRPKKCFSFFDS